MELEPVRMRKYARRSRTGCTTCRQRHVRCDEQRPVCANCARLGKECEYAPSVPPGYARLYGSGAVAATQFVWQVSQERMDPFDSLSLSMDAKSRELIHYFAQVNAKYSGQAEDPSKDSLTWSIQAADPSALRAVVLMALLHYRQNTGTLHHFYLTYLQHKAECIQTVNRHLQDLNPQKMHLCLKLASVLSILEIHLGDLNKAALHTNGILALLERIASLPSAEYRDLFERFFLIVSYYASVVRAGLRLQEVQAADTVRWNFRHDLILQKQILEGLRYVPYFVSGPAGVAPSMLTTIIDGGPSLQDLGEVTTLVTEYYRTRTQGGQCSIDEDPTAVDLLGCKVSPQLALARLYVATLHVSKDGSDQAERGQRMASWSSFVSSYGFYFTMLLGGSEPESFFGPKIVWHMASILRRELARSEPDMEAGLVDRDLWLWMLFSATCVLAKAQDKPQADREYCTDEFRRTRQWLESRIRLWSRVTGVIDWYGAKEALCRVLWPEGLPRAEFVELVWTRALEGQTRDGGPRDTRSRPRARPSVD